MWIKFKNGSLMNADSVAMFAYNEGRNVTYAIFEDASKVSISDGNIVENIADSIRHDTTVMEVQ